MSLHSSLRQSSNKNTSRTVLKREERIKKMIEKGQWDENSKAYGLPKMKVTKIKLAKKSSKPEKEESEEAK
jgi:small basic protein (TIGR04137 family)